MLDLLKRAGAWVAVAAVLVAGFFLLRRRWKDEGALEHAEKDAAAKAKNAGELALEGEARAKEAEAARKALESKVHAIDVEEDQLLHETPSEAEADALLDEAKRGR